MREVRQKDGKNRKCLGAAPEKVPALRGEGRAAAVRSSDSVQRVRLVCDRLCGKIKHAGKWIEKSDKSDKQDKKDSPAKESSAKESTTKETKQPAKKK
jgi:hypothetical protein